MQGEHFKANFGTSTPAPKLGLALQEKFARQTQYRQGNPSMSISKVLRLTFAEIGDDLTCSFHGAPRVAAEVVLERKSQRATTCEVDRKS